MKALLSLMLMISIISCDKSEDAIELKLDDIQGTWRWLSTCGGFSGSCIYRSNSGYHEITFDTLFKFKYSNSDTVNYFADYRIDKKDDISGILNLYNQSVYNSFTLNQRTIAIYDNILIIYRGTLSDSYEKIK